jgi:hypothetical protein
VPTTNTIEIAIACVSVYQDGRVVDKSKLTGVQQRVIMDNDGNTDY